MSALGSKFYLMKRLNLFGKKKRQTYWDWERRRAAIYFDHSKGLTFDQACKKHGICRATLWHWDRRVSAA